MTKMEKLNFVFVLIGIAVAARILQALTSLVDGPFLGDGMQPIFTAAGGIIGLAVIACVYFLPTVIAYRRGHPQLAAIAVLNILAGWTIIAWAIALVWSVTNQRAAQ
jgi:hypothetical protein